MIIRPLLGMLAGVSTVSLAFAAAAPSPVVERKVITSDAARTIVDTCIAFSRGVPNPAAVAVVDPAGTLISFHTMQDANETTSTTAQLKARSAARWRRSTADLHQRVTTGVNRAPEWMGGFPQPGALPIFVDGQLVGAVGVGGGNDDEACARAGIEAVFGPNATPPPVTQAQ